MAEININEININTDEDINQTQENEDKYEIVTRGNKTYKIFNNGIEKIIYSKEKTCSIVYLDTYEGQQIDKIYLPHDFDFDSYEASLIFKYKNIEKGLKWNLLWHIEKIFKLSGKNLKKIIIILQGESKVARRGDDYYFYLLIDDIEQLFSEFASINRALIPERKMVIAEFLNTISKGFYSEQVGKDRMKQRILTYIMALPLDSYTKNDLNQLSAFFDNLFTNEHNKLRKREILINSKVTIDNEVLKDIIKEYQKNIDDNVLEATWQKFFEKNLLLFDSRYINIFPKVNVVEGTTKEPDFLAVDIYQNTDVIELKRPNTPLLKYDDSRKVYHWSEDLAKALAQVEKYLFHIDAKRDSLPVAMRRAGFINSVDELKIIRVRGKLIVGHSEQLKNDNMKEDFEILRRAQNKIEIVLYDELLEWMKNRFQLNQSRKK